MDGKGGSFHDEMKTFVKSTKNISISTPAENFS